MDKTFEEIEQVMNSSFGTDSYHILNLFAKNVVATDGVLAVLQFAECFWLFDVIASYYPKMVKTQDSFFVAKLTVKSGKAVFKITREVYDPIKEKSVNKNVARQEIPFTDLPSGEYKFFICVQPTETKKYYVVMCPSEY